MPETICKVIKQYNEKPVTAEDMRKLQEIAEDYRKVKNYVYDRFGGIGGLSKLYPGYTVQNEMTRSGLRKELGMPSVYFYLAVFDALGDIKCQWIRTKSKISGLISKNENLTVGEKHYLRFVLKVSNAFTAVLWKEPIKLEGKLQEKYDEVSRGIAQEGALAQERESVPQRNPDIDKLHRYLCRQVRRYHPKLHTSLAEGFSVSPKAYRYGDHGIYLATKERRRRIFVPLTDGNEYDSQIYIRLRPEEKGIIINVPVNVAARFHADYVNEIGISVGMYTMATTDAGHKYGERLGEYQDEYSEWLREQMRIYSRNKAANPGRKKYLAKKKRYTERLHSYINQELNRLLEEEKPQTIYMAKLPKARAGGINRSVNQKMSMWQRGYIRKRLELKCREQSVELLEIFGKGISSECSNCGRGGSRRDGMFTCSFCGYSAEEKTNTARNTLKRGLSGKLI